MKFAALALSALWLASCAFAAEVLVIDDFEYPTADAARAAWAPMDKTDPVELMPRASDGGKTALKVPCTFSRREVGRGAVDRAVKLDLVKFGAITFDFYLDDPTPVNGCNIYFHSGAGWYRAAFVAAKGWTHVVISRGSLDSEDAPVGWNQIDTIRIGVWKGQDKDTFFAVDNLRARREDIAVIAGTPKGPEAKSARSVAAQVGELLSGMGVPFGTLTDDDVEAGALAGLKLALFAYSPSMTPGEITRIQEFVAAGGKIICFYSIADPVAKLLGVETLAWKRPPSEDGFADVAFNQAALTGLPAEIIQHSWNANIPTKLGPGAKVIGYWQDADGKRGEPAVVLSDTGAYMGHVLTDGDAPAKSIFLVSLLGHFVPAVWDQAAQHALDGAVQVGPFADRAELEAFLKQAAPGNAAQQQIAAKLTAAAEADRSARAAMTDKRYLDVLHQAETLNASLSAAYDLAHTPRASEFRAVWNHSGTGDCGTWEDAMKLLSAAHFNAVVPNMWWGGIAYYDSKFLPHAKVVQEKGDQIAQCVAAGKKYGIEVHPWKVNWNLGNAPKDFIEKMRAAGRTQKTAGGKDMDWLCPSHPDNLKLEFDTMLEVVRNYDVDGVHFDYIRYPQGDTCYCDGCRARFEAFLGQKVDNWPRDCFVGKLKSEYHQWRCDQITALVRSTSEAAHKLKPYIKISAAVFENYPGCKDEVGQDWVLWCKNGWLDFACPMDYTKSDSEFTNLATRQVGFVGGAVPLYTGIGAFIIPDEQAIGQAEISRARGADGFILFNMGDDLGRTGLAKFGKGITSDKALLPHQSPVIRFKTDFDDGQPIVFANKSPLTVEVTMPSLGAFRKQPTGATGAVELQDLDGKTLARLGDLPAVGQRVEFKIPRRQGTFRLAAVGKVTFEDGETRPFNLRSRPYAFSTIF